MQFSALKFNHLFQIAYKKGKKSVHPSVCVYCMKNYKKTGTYMGITVSTKQGGAVERNRAKRIVRAGYRAWLDAHPAFCGHYYIVIVARSGCYDGTFTSRDVFRDLSSAFRRLDILGEKEKV